MISFIRSIFLARVSLSIFLFLSIPTWLYVVTPRLLSLPPEFTSTTDVLTRESVYDPETENYKPERTYVGTWLSDVVTKKDSVLLVRSIYDPKVENKNGERSVIRIYGINPRSMTHDKENGDHPREGFLFAPRHLQKQDFTTWHVNYDVPILMRYQDEETMEGLRVFRYEAPNVVEESRHRGGTGREITLRSAGRLILWVEPVSGRIVSYEDYVKTAVLGKEGDEQGTPMGRVFRAPTRDGTAQLIEQARHEREQIIVIEYVAPLILGFFALLLLISLFKGKDIRLFGKQGAAQQTTNVPLLVCIVISLVAVFITLLAWRFVQRSVAAQENSVFSSDIGSVERAIITQADMFDDFLKEADLQQESRTGFDEQGWRRFLTTLANRKYHPGLQGIGFALYNQTGSGSSGSGSSGSGSSGSGSLLRNGDRGGISSEGQAVVTHFESFDQGAKEMIGTDFMTDDLLRTAFTTARDEETTILSPRFITDTGGNRAPQSGFLFIHPVYQRGGEGEITGSGSIMEAQRRKNLLGYFFAKVRVSEFIEGALSSNPAIHIQMYDGIWDQDPLSEREGAMYIRNLPIAQVDEWALRKTRVIYPLNHPWTITVARYGQEGTSILQRKLPPVVLWGGLTLSWLLFGFLYFLTTSRERAVDIAEEMTSQLREEKGRTDQQNALLELLLEHLPFGVFLAKASTGETMIVNRIGVAMLGKSIGLPGLNDAEDRPYKFLKPDGSPYPDEEFPLAITLQTGELVTKEDVVINKLGSDPIHARATSALVRDSAGSPSATILVLEDITKEDRAKTEFVSLASHQLLTPLTSIGWYVEMLLNSDAGEVTDEQRQYLTEIHQGNKRMVDLVVSLLNVSRIDLGTFTIDPQPANLVEICESVLKDLTSQIQPRHTKIVKQYAPDMPEINADANLMRIVFQNLLSNAVKYTREGGEITIAITKQTSHILIQISDNGLGIPSEQQERIFSKFFRADNVRSEVTDGNGLGLHIVRAALEAGGGKIWFESKENEGTTFYITLPLEGMRKKKGTKALQLMGKI